MGLSFVAIGVSIPDVLASVAVARDGKSRAEDRDSRTAGGREGGRHSTNSVMVDVLVGGWPVLTIDSCFRGERTVMTVTDASLVAICIISCHMCRACFPL